MRPETLSGQGYKAIRNTILHNYKLEGGVLLTCEPLETAGRSCEALVLTGVVLGHLDVPLPGVLEVRVHVYHDPVAEVTGPDVHVLSSVVAAYDGRSLNTFDGGNVRD